MHRLPWSPVLLGALSGLLLSLAACDASETDPPETTRYTKTIEARHAEADSVVTTAELSAGGSSFGSDGVGTLTREEGTTQVVDVSAPNFEDESVAVPFENGSTFTVDMTPTNNAPTAVATVDRDQAETDETVTFTGEQSSDPNDDDLTYSWTFPDGNASGESVQRSFGSTGDKTAELIVSDGERTDDAEVTVTITEPTTAVTVEAVSVENQQTLGSQIELLVADSVYTAGESPLTADVPESVDELTASVAEHEKESEVYADTSDTFVIADSPVTVGQRRVPHCVNGFDNDGDGLIGVWTDEDGNEIPTEGDGGDPGCTTESDDNENHLVFTQSSGGEATRRTFVSSEKDNWAFKEYKSSNFPRHIRVAVGNISFSRNVRLSSEQSGESFATRFECGSEVNISAVTEDDSSVDGWYKPILEGITTDWFSQSTDCEIGYVHKAFVNDNPGDGDDDVVLSEDGHVRSLVISWVFEPDHPDLSGSSQPQAVSAQSDVDTAIRSTGYVPTENR